MKMSSDGVLLARPAYIAAAACTLSLSPDAITAPPTGTRKFLSPDYTKKSTRPQAMAVLIARIILTLCMPYALLMTWAMLYDLHNLAIAITSSGRRGAKQLVVESTHKTCDLPPN